MRWPSLVKSLNLVSFIAAQPALAASEWQCLQLFERTPTLYEWMTAKTSEGYRSAIKKTEAVQSATADRANQLGRPSDLREARTLQRFLGWLETGNTRDAKTALGELFGDVIRLKQEIEQKDRVLSLAIRSGLGLHQMRREIVELENLGAKFGPLYGRIVDILDVAIPIANDQAPPKFIAMNTNGEAAVSAMEATVESAPSMAPRPETNNLVIFDLSRPHTKQTVNDLFKFLGVRDPQRFRAELREIFSGNKQQNYVVKGLVDAQLKEMQRAAFSITHIAEGITRATIDGVTFGKLPESSRKTALEIAGVAYNVNMMTLYYSKIWSVVKANLYFENGRFVQGTQRDYLETQLRELMRLDDEAGEKSIDFLVTFFRVNEFTGIRANIMKTVKQLADETKDFSPEYQNYFKRLEKAAATAEQLGKLPWSHNRSVMHQVYTIMVPLVGATITASLLAYVGNSLVSISNNTDAKWLWGIPSRIMKGLAQFFTRQASPDPSGDAATPKKPQPKSVSPPAVDPTAPEPKRAQKPEPKAGPTLNGNAVDEADAK